MCRRVLAILVLATTIAGAAPVMAEELVLREFYDGSVTLLLPVSFQPMSEEMLRFKYPSERRPSIVYTDPKGAVNVALNHTNDKIPKDAIAETHKIMEQGFRNLYPSATWNRSEVLSKSGRSYFIMDLRTPAIDTEVRNIMFGSSLDGRLMQVSFNCTRELEPSWGEYGQRIIESVMLRE